MHLHSIIQLQQLLSISTNAAATLTYKIHLHVEFCLLLCQLPYLSSVVRRGATLLHVLLSLSREAGSSDQEQHSKQQLDVSTANTGSTSHAMAQVRWSMMQDAGCSQVQ